MVLMALLWPLLAGGLKPEAAGGSGVESPYLGAGGLGALGSLPEEGVGMWTPEIPGQDRVEGWGTSQLSRTYFLKFIYLKFSAEREREKASHLLAHTPDVCSSWGWGSPKPQALSSTHVSHSGGRMHS